MLLSEKVSGGGGDGGVVYFFLLPGVYHVFRSCSLFANRVAVTTFERAEF